MGGLHYDSLADLPPQMRQQVAGKLLQKPAQADPVAGADKKKSKYHNVKVAVNGIKFDSKKEARRYLALMDAVHEGVISDLRLQREFTLQEAYTTPEGQRIRAIRYRADFTYKVMWAGYNIPTSVGFEDLDYWRSIIQQYGREVLVVEDVKSRATKTSEYEIKRKMMAERGHIIREV